MSVLKTAPNTSPRVGRPPLASGSDCKGFPSRPRNPSVPHAGLSKRQAHASRRSQFVDSSTCGQPPGLRATRSPLVLSSSRRAPLRGPIQAVRVRALCAARPCRDQRPTTQARADCTCPCRPSSATSSPQRAGRFPHTVGPAVARTPAPVAPRAGLLRGEELAGVEGLLFTQQVVDGPTQPRRERPQGAGLAVLLLAPRQPAFGRLARTQEQCGRLRKRPLQVRVADLVPSRTLLLPGRLVDAAD